jgi:hypothetical protein
MFTVVVNVYHVIIHNKVATFFGIFSIRNIFGNEPSFRGGNSALSNSLTNDSIFLPKGQIIEVV